MKTGTLYGWIVEGKRYMVRAIPLRDDRGVQMIVQGYLLATLDQSRKLLATRSPFPISDYIPGVHGLGILEMMQAAPGNRLIRIDFRGHGTVTRDAGVGEVTEHADFSEFAVRG